METTTNPKRQAKNDEIARVRAAFDRSVAAVLLDFRGLDVETITALRARFREKGVEYRVVKNTLVMKALAGTPLGASAAFEAHLAGPTGIAWSFEDPSAAAKVVKAFRKENEAHEKLKVKCGVLDTHVFVGDRVESELATLPGRDEIRASLLAQLMAPMQALARQLSAPAQNLTYALDAKARQG